MIHALENSLEKGGGGVFKISDDGDRSGAGDFDRAKISGHAVVVNQKNFGGADNFLSGKARMGADDAADFVKNVAAAVVLANDDDGVDDAGFGQTGRV